MRFLVPVLSGWPDVANTSLWAGRRARHDVADIWTGNFLAEVRLRRDVSCMSSVCPARGVPMATLISAL
jgi:hypothetical protein